MPGSQRFRSVVTGLAGGAFSGLTGVGGGAMMVPLLTGQLKLGQHRAHGTSLAIILFVAVAGAAAYAIAGNVDWQLALALTPGAIAGVYIGARAMVRVPEPELRILFGAFLFFVAFRQLVWEVTAGAPSSGAEGLALELGFGFAGGVLAGMLGVGGGAIFVPAIVIFGLAGTDDGGNTQQVAQGVSLVVIVATAFAGSLTNARQGVLDVPTMSAVAPAAIAAAVLAAIIANSIDATLLKRIYGVTALVLGFETVYSGWRAMQVRRETQEA